MPLPNTQPVQPRHHHQPTFTTGYNIAGGNIRNYHHSQSDSIMSGLSSVSNPNSHHIVPITPATHNNPPLTANDDNMNNMNAMSNMNNMRINAALPANVSPNKSPQLNSPKVGNVPTPEIRGSRGPSQQPTPQRQSASGGKNMPDLELMNQGSISTIPENEHDPSTPNIQQQAQQSGALPTPNTNQQSNLSSSPNSNTNTHSPLTPEATVLHQMQHTINPPAPIYQSPPRQHLQHPPHPQQQQFIIMDQNGQPSPNAQPQIGPNGNYLNVNSVNSLAQLGINSIPATPQPIREITPTPTPPPQTMPKRKTSQELAQLLEQQTNEIMNQRVVQRGFSNHSDRNNNNKSNNNRPSSPQTPQLADSGPNQQMFTYDHSSNIYNGHVGRIVVEPHPTRVDRNPSSNSQSSAGGSSSESNDELSAADTVKLIDKQALKGVIKRKSQEAALQAHLDIIARERGDNSSDFTDSNDDDDDDAMNDEAPTRKQQIAHLNKSLSKIEHQQKKKKSKLIKKKSGSGTNSSSVSTPDQASSPLQTHLIAQNGYNGTPTDTEFENEDVPQLEHADSAEMTELVITNGHRPKVHRRRSSILSSHCVPPPKQATADGYDAELDGGELSMDDHSTIESMSDNDDIGNKNHRKSSKKNKKKKDNLPLNSTNSNVSHISSEPPSSPPMLPNNKSNDSLASTHSYKYTNNATNASATNHTHLLHDKHQPILTSDDDEEDENDKHHNHQNINTNNDQNVITENNVNSNINMQPSSINTTTASINSRLLQNETPVSALDTPMDSMRSVDNSPVKSHSSMISDELLTPQPQISPDKDENTESPSTSHDSSLEDGLGPKRTNSKHSYRKSFELANKMMLKMNIDELRDDAVSPGDELQKFGTPDLPKKIDKSRLSEPSTPYKIQITPPVDQHEDKASYSIAITTNETSNKSNTSNGTSTSNGTNGSSSPFNNVDHAKLTKKSSGERILSGNESPNSIYAEPDKSPIPLSMAGTPNPAPATPFTPFNDDDEAKQSRPVSARLNNSVINRPELDTIAFDEEIDDDSKHSNSKRDLELDKIESNKSNGSNQSNKSSKKKKKKNRKLHKKKHKANTPEIKPPPKPSQQSNKQIPKKRKSILSRSSTQNYDENDPYRARWDKDIGIDGDDGFNHDLDSGHSTPVSVNHGVGYDFDLNPNNVDNNRSSEDSQSDNDDSSDTNDNSSSEEGDNFSSSPSDHDLDPSDEESETPPIQKPMDNVSKSKSKSPKLLLNRLDCSAPIIESHGMF